MSRHYSPISYFQTKVHLNALNILWRDFGNDYLLKNVLNYNNNLFFWGSWYVFHSKLIFLCSKLKNLKKKTEKNTSLIPGLTKAPNSNSTFFHTSWWYLDVWKPGIKLVWPKIGLGELFWGCKYWQITRANNMIVIVLWVPAYPISEWKIIFTLFGRSWKWLDLKTLLCSWSETLA